MLSIKKNRERLKITQKELAVQLGVTQGAVSHWETGSCGPHPILLLKLAEIFHCTVDELLREDSAKNDPPEESAFP